MIRNSTALACIMACMGHRKDQSNGIEMGYDENYHTEGSEWHRTEQGAKDFANLMVAKKIKSLKAQIKRLEQLKF